jgi:ribosome maturation protein SDO1
MSRQINQAVNRVTLTNVAIVRLKRNGKRYEVACYANKISQYRQGIETLEETLQTTHIFENVAKATLYRKVSLDSFL